MNNPYQKSAFDEGDPLARVRVLAKKLGKADFRLVDRIELSAGDR